MMKLSLRIIGSGGNICGHWRESEPFVQNKFGLLIHRPTSVTLYNTSFGAHIGVHFWCGNCSSGPHNKYTFLEAPPKNMLICHNCEMKAVAHGQKSSSELAGQHVCIGRLKAINICHPEAQ